MARGINSDIMPKRIPRFTDYEKFGDFVLSDATRRGNVVTKDNFERFESRYSDLHDRLYGYQPGDQPRGGVTTNSTNA